MSTIANKFLEQFFDPALEPPAVGSREELQQRGIDRLSEAISVVLLAGTIPRRLGGDATDEELALDRRRARRAGYALNQSLKGWTKKPPALPLSDAIRQKGAQLIWSKWGEEHLATVANELRCFATWAVLNNEQRWGRSAVVWLENERKWVDYALRD